MMSESFVSSEFRMNIVFVIYSTRDVRERESAPRERITKQNTRSFDLYFEFVLVEGPPRREEIQQ
jgi:hypothetical protein